jgi:hypothetical protein
MIWKGGKLLLNKRNGFWELPEAGDLTAATHLHELGRFRHAIMNRIYIFTVALARVRRKPEGYNWFSTRGLELIPLATTARKALLKWNKRRGLLVNS